MAFFVAMDYVLDFLFWFNAKMGISPTEESGSKAFMRDLLHGFFQALDIHQSLKNLSAQRVEELSEGKQHSKNQQKRLSSSN